MDADDPWSIPDLVLIDGGLGQLNAACKGMAKVGVLPKQNSTVNMKPTIEREGDEFEIVEEVLPDYSYDDLPTVDESQRSTSVAVCALAKNQEELFVHGQKSPVNNSPDSPALLLLRSLRDESHRFALNAHRKRRSAANLRP